MLYRNRSNRLKLPAPVIATLGNFDGLHQGHQALFSRVIQIAKESKGATSVAISFYPHPVLVLKKATHIPLILSLEQKCKRITQFSIENLYLIHFTPRISKLSAKEFIRQELIEKLDVQHLVIGPDAHIGKGREGGPEVICELMREFGRKAQIEPEVVDSGTDRKISSGMVREALSKGELVTANRLLGFPFRLWGRVVKGLGRGAPMGIPTANIHTRDQQLLPFGVYAAQLFIDGSPHLSVCNIGIRPTFSGQKPSVEAHILSYAGKSLYGEKVELEPLAFIRPEQKFSGPSDLVTQIKRDIEVVRKGWGNDSNH